MTSCYRKTEKLPQEKRKLDTAMGHPVSLTFPLLMRAAYGGVYRWSSLHVPEGQFTRFVLQANKIFYGRRTSHIIECSQSFSFFRGDKLGSYVNEMKLVWVLPLDIFLCACREFIVLLIGKSPPCHTPSLIICENVCQWKYMRVCAPPFRCPPIGVNQREQLSDNQENGKWTQIEQLTTTTTTTTSTINVATGMAMSADGCTDNFSFSYSFTRNTLRVRVRRENSFSPSPMDFVHRS